MRWLVLLLLLLVFVPAAGAWTWPVQGPVLQTFSFDQAHPYAGGQHRGIAIGAAQGGEVLAPASGVVSFAGSVPTNGQTLTILTPSGLAVSLTHLGSIGVARNESVDEGAVVGAVGPSGTPEFDVPYVHLGIRDASNDQGYLDPLAFLPVLAPPPAPPALAPEPALAPAPAPVAPAPVPVAVPAVAPLPAQPVAQPAPVPSAAQPVDAPSAPPVPAPPVVAVPTATQVVEAPAVDPAPPATSPLPSPAPAGPSLVVGPSAPAPAGFAARPLPVPALHLNHPGALTATRSVLELPRAAVARLDSEPAPVWHPAPWTPSRVFAAANRPAVGSSAHAAVDAPGHGGLPAYAFALLALGAAVVAFVVVRMISSPPVRNEGARPGTEDPRRAGLALRQWAAPYRPRGRVRRAGGRLRALSTAEGQRRADGERNGRARHAGDGVRRPRWRVAA